jgi:hypothetical protein
MVNKIIKKKKKKKNYYYYYDFVISLFRVQLDPCVDRTANENVALTGESKSASGVSKSLLHLQIYKKLTAPSFQYLCLDPDQDFKNTNPDLIHLLEFTFVRGGRVFFLAGDDLQQRE